MPLYDFECAKCAHAFEAFHKMNEGSEEIACPQCGAKNPKKIITKFRTNNWSNFLDTMEKRVSPHKFKHNLKEI